MFWYVTFAVLVVLLYIWYEYEFAKYNNGVRNIPGPIQLPLFGNALQVSSTVDVLRWLMLFRNEFGGIFKARIGPIKPLIAFSDYKSAEFLLTNTKLITKGEQYRYLQNWLGTGLLTSTGEKWKKHRKMITPSFHFKILEDFVSVFNAHSTIFVQKLRERLGEDSFDVYPLSSLCTLDIICETAMGTKVNAQENSESEYVKSVREMGRIIIERTFSLKMFDIVYRFSKDYHKENTARTILHGYSLNVIKKRREQLENNANYSSSSQVDELGRKRRLAFLDLLMMESNKSENPLTDVEIREEVDTFMFEGHDTTSIAISMLLYSLGNNPDVQKKVMEELDQVFSVDENRDPTYQDLQEMKYLDMCIKETLRLYPSVPVYARQFTEDTEYDGHFIKKGTTVGIFAYGMQRDPEIFPKPNKFIPERFDPSNKLISPFAYVPFSAGQRNCIGQKFAILEMKSTVSKVLRHFEVLPAIPECIPILTAETVLKSANGVHIRLVERKTKI